MIAEKNSSSAISNVKEEDRRLLSDRLTTSEIENLKDYKQKVQKFIKVHQDKGSKNIFLLSSGGTSVPLQKNTVRMVQNFSTGTRGSLLAQQILKQNHPLIYFYRDNCFLPFMAGVTASGLVLSKNEQQVLKFVESRKNLHKYQQNLLLLPFKTIYFYLQGILQLKSLLPYKSLIVLCAAVSDFIPEQVSQHKIHTQDNLQVRFKNSPKILGNLVDSRHLTVSFKLETDKTKIDERILFAIEKYQIDMVVGNVLDNKKWVKIVYNPKYNNLLSQQFQQNIEKNIVECSLKCLNVKFAENK